MIPGETEPAGLRGGLGDPNMTGGVHWYHLHLLVVTELSTEMEILMNHHENHYLVSL